MQAYQGILFPLVYYTVFNDFMLVIKALISLHKFTTYMINDYFLINIEGRSGLMASPPIRIFFFFFFFDMGFTALSRIFQ